MKKLSIIILSFNTKKILEMCLSSVLKEITNDKNFELIVVDNGSTDGSVKMIETVIRDQLSGTGKKKSVARHRLLSANHQPLITGNRSPITISLIRNQENFGFSKAVNQGIKRSTGELILLLNSDTIIQKDFFKNLLNFENKVSPAIIGVKFLDPDKKPQPSVFHLPTIKRAMEEFWFGKTGSFSKYLPETDDYIEADAVSGGGMLIPKAIIDKIGLLDERYFFYFEDLEYCRRARKNGYKVYYYPGSQLIHLHGTSGTSLAGKEDQWKRLIPSSKIYYGPLKHYLITFIIWTGQKWKRVLGKK